MLYEIIAGLGIFTGCVARAVVPFLKKQLAAAKEGSDFRWKRQYTITIVLSLVIAVPTALFVLASFPIPETLIFPAGFMAGYASQDVVNKVVT